MIEREREGGDRDLWNLIIIIIMRSLMINYYN